MKVLHVILSVFYCCLFSCLFSCSDKYYDAQIAYYQAQIELNKVPIAKMTAPDGTEFVVNSQGQIKQAENPVVKTVSVLASSNLASILAMGWSLSEFITATANHKTEISSTTQTPVIVTQPEPIIVTQPNTQIVTQPEPIIVTQPEPIIVTQPEPIIVQSVQD